MRKLKDIRETAGRRVSTIHSFCAASCGISRLKPMFIRISRSNPRPTPPRCVATPPKECYHSVPYRRRHQSNRARLFSGAQAVRLCRNTGRLPSRQGKTACSARILRPEATTNASSAKYCAIELIKPVVAQTVNAVGEVLECLKGVIFTSKQGENISETAANYRYLKELLSGDVTRNVIGQILGLLLE